MMKPKNDIILAKKRKQLIESIKIPINFNHGDEWWFRGDFKETRKITSNVSTLKNDFILLYRDDYTSTGQPERTNLQIQVVDG